MSLQQILNILSNKKSDNVVNKLFEKPKKDVGKDATHFDYPTAGYYQQADLLFLPNDMGYQYALVVVDQGSRKTDIEPLKAKNSSDIVQALKKIYKRNILKKPIVLKTDSGLEFKNRDLQNELNKMGIHILYAKAGRHRSVSLAERKNQTIGKIIHKIIVNDTISTGRASSAWVSVLPTIVEAINKKVEEQPKKNTNVDHSNPKLELLNIGQKVRLMLDNPKDLSGSNLVGRFRSHDIRFDPKERTITDILLKPNQPPMYVLNGEEIGYTRNQLQLIEPNEKKPENVIANIKDAKNRYEVKSIVGHKIVKGKRLYLVWWKGYKKKEATYEPENNLMEDVPQMLIRYKNKHNL